MNIITEISLAVFYYSLSCIKLQVFNSKIGGVSIIFHLMYYYYSCRSQRKTGGRKSKNNFEFWVSLKWELKGLAHNHYGMCFSTTETT